MGFSVESMDDFITGAVIPVNKPYEWTSFDIVKKIKNQISKKLRQTSQVRLKNFKVGHAGTLDPLAEGLVLLCTGKATKQINQLMADEKEYVATIVIGKTTPSYDLETQFDKEFSISHINEKLVTETLKSFLGEQDQIPPVFSAKFIDGKRAYDYARKGQEVEMKPSRISITEIELLEYNLPEITFKVVCSKGTYIRSLANDIGKRLDSGAYLKKLTRTRIGTYKLDSAITIEEFEIFLTTL